MEAVKLRRTQVQTLKRIAKEHGLEQHKSIVDNSAKAKIEALAADIASSAVAKNCMASLRKTCRKVQKNKGGAIGRRG